jgi:phenylacetic acid degradation operon negative regulatory protein
MTAHELVVDFLSNRAPREMSASAIVAAARALSFSDQSIRMALARAVSRGIALSERRGTYRLARAGDAMRREVRKWRAVTSSTRAWDGNWIAVLDAQIPRANRAQMRRHERATRLRGFRPLQAGLWLRPANLKISTPALREELAALGLHSSAIVASVGDFDERTQARAAKLWDTAALCAEYARVTAEIAVSTKRLHSLDTAKAAGDTLVLGREAIRLINLDPLLPPDLMPPEPLNALVGAMNEYDQVGRACWREFMAQIERRK